MSENETSFQVTAWDEEPIVEIDDGEGAKITRAKVKQTYTGDIVGESTVEYVMYHRSDRSATFVGVEHVVGRFNDKSGSFVLQHAGEFSEGEARSNWFVIPGSATGELRGLTGKGSFAAGHDMKGIIRHDLTLGA